MRVCMVTTGFPRFEGDFCGSFILDLCKSLVRQSVEVLVLCPHEAGIPTRACFDGVEVRRFRYALPTSLQRLAYGGGIPANLRNSWLARAEVAPFMGAMAAAVARWGREADVIHAHWAASGFAACLGRFAAHRPVVLTVHGSDLKRIKNAYFGWIVRRALRSADHILAVSEDLCSEVLRRGVSPDKTSFVPNGISLEKFRVEERPAARRRLGLGADARIALFVGQLAPVKNPLVLAEAAAALRDCRPPLEVHVVGDGPEAGALRARAAELGASDRLVIHGFKPKHEIPRWVAAADLLILPSHSEGWPMVILEAMAAERPVVATRVGGIPEMVAEGTTGLLVEADDAGAFSSAIRSLLADDRKREDMGAAGRERLVEMGWSLETQARRHVQVYRDKLAAHINRARSS